MHPCICLLEHLLQFALYKFRQWINPISNLFSPWYNVSWCFIVSECINCQGTCFKVPLVVAKMYILTTILCDTRWGYIAPNCYGWRWASFRGHSEGKVVPYSWDNKISVGNGYCLLGNTPLWNSPNGACYCCVFNQTGLKRPESGANALHSRLLCIITELPTLHISRDDWPVNVVCFDVYPSHSLLFARCQKQHTHLRYRKPELGGCITCKRY